MSMNGSIVKRKVINSVFSGIDSNLPVIRRGCSADSGINVSMRNGLPFCGFPSCNFNMPCLLVAVKNGKDLKARIDLLAAASMGSTAFQKGLGAIHSLSHPVNAQFNIHHGLSNAIFMPYVLTFNKNVIENKIITICDYLNLKKNFQSFLDWILDLRKKLNIPHKLSDVVDIKKIDLEQLSKMAFEDPSTGGNPKKITIDDMKILYEHSISGKLF